MMVVLFVCVFVFFKQKTAYEMRISDWSSDVCSSDLLSSGDGARAVEAFASRMGIAGPMARQSPEDKLAFARRLQAEGRVVAMVGDEIGRASCRESVCQYV